MRLNPQKYPGDSIPQPETGSSGNVVSASDAVASGAPVVRRNMEAGNVPESEFDFEAIEREARALRAAWISSKLSSYYEALVRKLRAESNFTAAATVLKGVGKKAA